MIRQCARSSPIEPTARSSRAIASDRRVPVFTGVGLFVPKPTTDADCQRPSTRGLRQTVRGRPLPSPAVRGDCHSLCHSAVREPVVSGCCPHTLSESARLDPGWFNRVCDPRLPVVDRGKSASRPPVPDEPTSIVTPRLLGRIMSLHQQQARGASIRAGRGRSSHEDICSFHL